MQVIKHYTYNIFAWTGMNMNEMRWFDFQTAQNLDVFLMEQNFNTVLRNVGFIDNSLFLKTTLKIWIAIFFSWVCVCVWLM